MARNFIASSVSDLEAAGRSASASVMGPAIRNLTTDLLNDWTDNTKFYEELSSALLYFSSSQTCLLPLRRRHPGSSCH